MRDAVASSRVQDIGRMEPTFAELAEFGASSALVESLIAAAEASEDESPVGDKDWRSEHERFLFELLEHTPDLSGLFQLNVDPGFPLWEASG